jgi:hypothetical protein
MSRGTSVGLDEPPRPKWWRPVEHSALGCGSSIPPARGPAGPSPPIFIGMATNPHLAVAERDSSGLWRHYDDLESMFHELRRAATLR